MPIQYKEVGTPLTGTVTVKSGNAEDEALKLVAYYERNGASRKKEMKSSLDLKVVDGKATFDWETTRMLKEGDLFLPLRLELKGSQVYGMASLVLYQSTIEVHAVDAQNKAVEGATCQLTVHVDEGFAASGRPYDQNYVDGPHGAKIWTRVTDEEGKAVFSGLPLGQVTIAWKAPYMLTDTGWKTEGEFTTTGPKRKAEIVKAPLVHYIWWGNPRAGVGKGDEYLTNAKTTPNTLAQQKVNVMYWRQDDAADLSAQLHARVLQQPITTPSASKLLNEDNQLPIGLFMGRGLVIDNIVKTLARYNAYSAVKDFISLLVLYKYGGYYFDTTTALVEDDVASIPDKLIEHDELKFVRTRKPDDPSQTRTTTLLIDDRSSEATGMVGMLPTSAPGVVEVPNVDVWGIYAPPRHQAIEIMIDSYIERCLNYGFDRYNSNDKTHSIMTLAIPEEKQADKGRGQRNAIIGNLIIASVQEGLYKYAQQKGLSVTDYTWETEKPAQPTADKHHVAAVCNDLGIGKKHAGQWRTAAVT